MDRIKISLQFYLLAFAAALGFADVYAVIWRLVGLPLAWWSSVVTAVLGVGSVWALVEWITKGARGDG